MTAPLNTFSDWCQRIFEVRSASDLDAVARELQAANKRGEVKRFESLVLIGKAKRDELNARQLDLEYEAISRNK